MSKNKSKKNLEEEQVEPLFDEKVEKVYKRILRTMSWIVGVCFIAIIILPQFNSDALDSFTQILYYIGITTLLVFIVIEFIGDSIKRMINSIIK